jgi:dienelactone hydrolase
VASYGYFVVAANSRWVGAGTPAPMLHALDYAAAANMDSTSPYYQKLDMTKVGAMGHSQGGSATATAASDSRVKDVIIFNAVDSGVAKPYLSASADMDITGFTAASMATAIDAAAQPAAYLYWHNPVGMGSLRGHLVIMLSPERAIGPTVAWWQMMFRNDSASHDMLVGANCGFCNHSSDYNYGANTVLK